MFGNKQQQNFKRTTVKWYCLSKNFKSVRSYRKNVNEKLQKDKEFALQLDESTDVSVFEFRLKDCFRTTFGFNVKFNW